MIKNDAYYKNFFISFIIGEKHHAMMELHPKVLRHEFFVLRAVNV